MRGARRQALRVSLDAEHKFRIGKNAAQSHLDPSIESAFIAPGLIEIEHHFQIAVAYRPPERTTRQPRDDLLGAGGFLTPLRWLATEDQFAAGRIAHAGGIERTRNAHPVQVRQRRIFLLDSNESIER